MSIAAVPWWQSFVVVDRSSNKVCPACGIMPDSAHVSFLVLNSVSELLGERAVDV